MVTHVGHITILVKNQKEALDFYTKKMGFVVVEEHKDDKGGWLWLVVAPKKESLTVFTLMVPQNEKDMKLVGNQTGEIPLVILVTDDCRKDAAEMKKRGVEFIKDPKDEFWGVDALFKDLYGNIFDLCQPS